MIQGRHYIETTRYLDALAFTRGTPEMLQCNLCTDNFLRFIILKITETWVHNIPLIPIKLKGSKISVQENRHNATLECRAELVKSITMLQFLLLHEDPSKSEMLKTECTCWKVKKELQYLCRTSWTHLPWLNPPDNDLESLIAWFIGQISMDTN